MRGRGGREGGGATLRDKGGRVGEVRSGGEGGHCEEEEEGGRVRVDGLDAYDG